VAPRSQAREQQQAPLRQAAARVIWSAQRRQAPWARLVALVGWPVWEQQADARRC